jgi:hypothetical protein
LPLALGGVLGLSAARADGERVAVGDVARAPPPAADRFDLAVAAQRELAAPVGRVLVLHAEADAQGHRLRGVCGRDERYDRKDNDEEHRNRSGGPWHKNLLR